MTTNSNGSLSPSLNQTGNNIEDVHEATILIENLTKLLMRHDSITSDLKVLQSRIKQTQKRRLESVKLIEKRLIEAEKLWTVRLKELRCKWLEQCCNIPIESEIRRIQTASWKSYKTDVRGSEINGSADRSSFDRRKAAKLHVIERKIFCNKQRVRSIEARLKDLALRERNLNMLLTQHLNLRLRKTSALVVNRKKLEALYGICETTDTYKQMVDDLTNAIQSLEGIEQVPTKLHISKKSSTEGTPTVDEVEELEILMKRLLAKLKVQLASMDISESSNSAISPVHTAVESSPNPPRTSSSVANGASEASARDRTKNVISSVKPSINTSASVRSIVAPIEARAVAKTNSASSEGSGSAEVPGTSSEKSSESPTGTSSINKSVNTAKVEEKKPVKNPKATVSGSASYGTENAAVTVITARKTSTATTTSSQSATTGATSSSSGPTATSAATSSNPTSQKNITNPSKNTPSASTGMPTAVTPPFTSTPSE